MIESIQIEIEIGELGYKLISYKPIGFNMVDPSGIYYHAINFVNDTFIIDVHIPTYLNYDNDKHSNDTCFIIDQVIKQINRTNTINKLLNG